MVILLCIYCVCDPRSDVKVFDNISFPTTPWGDGIVPLTGLPNVLHKLPG